ncbi:MAG: hypothetical protein AVDCRST_MAG88-4304, partial [uncultured Thermomicrobiales bacterium]
GADGFSAITGPAGSLLGGAGAPPPQPRQASSAQRHPVSD